MCFDFDMADDKVDDFNGDCASVGGVSESGSMCFDFDSVGDVGDEREEAHAKDRKSKKKTLCAVDESVPEHVWKRFTPGKIDKGKCVARVWGAVAAGSATKHRRQGGVCAKSIASLRRTDWSQERFRTTSCRSS